MFHSVAPDPSSIDAHYNISPARFWHAISIARSLGFSFVTKLDVAERRQLVLTFDDGYEDLYSEVFPKFLEMGIRGIAFIVVGKMSQLMDWNPAIRKRLMTPSQMQEMHRHGFSFGSHTLTHCDLAGASPGMMRKEIFESKQRLEDLLGAAVTAFSYPWGLVNSQVREVVAEAGYTNAVTTESRLQRDNDDTLLIPRLTVSELDSSLGLISKLLTGRNFARLSPGRAWRRMHGPGING